jgi:hypothetical protein
MDIGVANYTTSPNGTRYLLTDEDSRFVGAVEVTGDLFNVRDQHDEPVRVGSPLYNVMTAAVRHFTAWQARH